MNRNTDIRSFEKLGLQNLDPRELREIEGGSRPPIGLMRLLRPASVTWKYVEGTPSWAIDAARGAGFEVEQID